MYRDNSYENAGIITVVHCAMNAVKTIKCIVDSYNGDDEAVPAKDTTDVLLRPHAGVHSHIFELGFRLQLCETDEDCGRSRRVEENVGYS